MPSPFPGMDPFLEANRVWPGFHHRLADEIADSLNYNIGPKYYAEVEVHTVMEDVTIAIPRNARPDVAVIQPVPPPAGGVAVAEREEIEQVEAPVRRVVVTQEMQMRTVNVFLTETDELVTAIEILSPANKQGDGLARYQEKRAQLLNADIHFVEIDLLRGGQRPGPEVNEPPLPGEYVLLVNRSKSDNPGRVSEIWPAPLNKPLPALPIPLLAPDPDVWLNMNHGIRAIYKRAGYDWRLSYEPPVPPPALSPEMEAWVVEVLAKKKDESKKEDDRQQE